MASTRATTDAATQSATVRGMTPVVTYVMTTVVAMVNAEDAEQELHDEERAAGRRTTQEHPHHTTYTRSEGR